MGGARERWGSTKRERWGFPGIPRDSNDSNGRLEEPIGGERDRDWCVPREIKNADCLYLFRLFGRRERDGWNSVFEIFVYNFWNVNILGYNFFIVEIVEWSNCLQVFFSINEGKKIWKSVLKFFDIFRVYKRKLTFFEIDVWNFQKITIILILFNIMLFIITLCSGKLR